MGNKSEFCKIRIITGTKNIQCKQEKTLKYQIELAPASISDLIKFLKIHFTILIRMRFFQIENLD